ncbi:MAG: N-acetyl sugar amidotransferase [Bacteroidetes bacterium]|nr:N-acetyl sugar amidotransferase [Bacteroidota bacterium]
MECKRCVLDTTVSDIQFYEDGFCNYCTDYLTKRSIILKESNELKILLRTFKLINQKYNCIVGVSGGLDSSFLLYKTVELGLKPLAVHIDTGWNTEISFNNILAITTKLNVDLKIFTLDWDQFKELQIAYLKSGVIDIEFPTDHYYLSALYKVASDLNIKHIITGNNYVSEGIMPNCWIHNKGDAMNMLDIYKVFGSNTSLHKLPTLTLIKKFYYYNIKKIENIFLLNYLSYHRDEAKKILTKECNWKEYPIKHGESIFTRFYQRYILPKRFNIDIRKAHLSSLICNNQITKKEALKILETDIIDETLLKNDKDFILKKLELSQEDFDKMMASPINSHFNFKSEIKIKKIYNTLTKAFLFRHFLKISNRH